MESASKVDTKRESSSQEATLNSHRLRPILCPHWASQKSQGPLIASCSLSCSVQTWMCRSCRPPRGATWRTGGLPGHSARPPHLTLSQPWSLGPRLRGPGDLRKLSTLKLLSTQKLKPHFFFAFVVRRRGDRVRERGTLTVASQRGACAGQVKRALSQVIGPHAGPRSRCDKVGAARAHRYIVATRRISPSVACA
jgi:hypothetical protein